MFFKGLWLQLKSSAHALLLIIILIKVVALPAGATGRSFTVLSNVMQDCFFVLGRKCRIATPNKANLLQRRF